MIPDISLSGLKPGDAADPKAVAAKVQGMFMEMMLKAMEDSVGAENGLFGGSASSDIYRGMLREQLAAAVSAHLKSPLEAQLNRAFQKSAQANSVESKTSDSTADLPISGIITSEKSWRRDPINGETRYHSGTDIAAPIGTPIRAVADGRVVESGPKGSYGNTVVIETADGRKMLYAHNNRNFVQAGDWVSRGEEIAEVGSTGRATGPHVHFEVKF